MGNIFNYSILRVVPDSGRGETINIGVVVFLDDRLDARILPSLNKLRAIDPNVNLEAVYALPEELDRLAGRGTAELRNQMLQQLPFVSTSGLGWFEIADQQAYEATIENIMRRLVMPPARAARRERAPSHLDRDLKKQFAKKNILGDKLDDVNHHRIVHHYPISVDDNLYADFVLRNGAWHVTETLDLRAKPETVRGDKFKQAAVKAITLDRASKVLGNGFTPLVVYAADQATLDIAQSHINLLSDYAERLYNFLDPSDLNAYLSRIYDTVGLSTIADGRQ